MLKKLILGWKSSSKIVAMPWATVSNSLAVGCQNDLEQIHQASGDRVSIGELDAGYSTQESSSAYMGDSAPETRLLRKNITVKWKGIFLKSMDYMGPTLQPARG
jgi:hypothetical protein